MKSKYDFKPGDKVIIINGTSYKENEKGIISDIEKGKTDIKVGMYKVDLIRNGTKTYTYVSPDRLIKIKDGLEDNQINKLNKLILDDKYSKGIEVGTLNTWYMIYYILKMSDENRIKYFGYSSIDDIFNYCKPMKVKETISRYFEEYIKVGSVLTSVSDNTRKYLVVDIGEDDNSFCTCLGNDFYIHNIGKSVLYDSNKYIVEKDKVDIDKIKKLFIEEQL